MPTLAEKSDRAEATLREYGGAHLTMAASAEMIVELLVDGTFNAAQALSALPNTWRSIVLGWRASMRPESGGAHMKSHVLIKLPFGRGPTRHPSSRTAPRHWPLATSDCSTTLAATPPQWFEATVLPFSTSNCTGIAEDISHGTSDSIELCHATRVRPPRRSRKPRRPDRSRTSKSGAR